jgi:molybdopterin molybdotransferase
MLPAVAKLLGLPETGPETVPATAGAPLRANDHRADHLRATLARDSEGNLVATPFERQDSGLLSVLSSAQCLVVRAPDAPALPIGAPVDVILLDRAGL